MMTTFASWLSRIAWPAFWQISVLIVLVGVVGALLCRRRPHLAYALWIVVLVKCITPPVWSSPTGVFSWLTAEHPNLNTETLASPALEFSQRQEPLRADSASVVLPISIREAAHAKGPQPADAPNLAITAVDSPHSALSWWSLAWGAGAIFYAITVSLTWVGFRRMIRRNRTRR